MRRDTDVTHCECESGRSFEVGCMTGRIRDDSIEFEYDAYSVDSSFIYNEVNVKINFCPFCGKKLSKETQSHVAARNQPEAGALEGDVLNATTVFEYHGYVDREDFLRRVAGDYEVSLLDVMRKAEELGEAEYFDGLITWLEGRGRIQRSRRDNRG